MSHSKAQVTWSHYEGLCSCRDCAYRISLPAPLASYAPRACDCDYCKLRAAAYLSAPESRIELYCKGAWHRERQGSEQAEFYSCARCGDLLAVVATLDGTLRGAVNASCLVLMETPAPALSASPKSLDASKKRERWASVWGIVVINPSV